LIETLAPVLRRRTKKHGRGRFKKAEHALGEILKISGDRKQAFADIYKDYLGTALRDANRRLYLDARGDVRYIIPDFHYTIPVNPVH
jgi:hypothetical protein